MRRKRLKSEQKKTNTNAPKRMQCWFTFYLPSPNLSSGIAAYNVYQQGAI
jgi:hypothetical protein